MGIENCYFRRIEFIGKKEMEDLLLVMEVVW